MINKGGWEAAIRGELATKNVTLTEGENINYNKVIQKLRNHKGNNTTFSPVTGISNLNGRRNRLNNIILE